MKKAVGWVIIALVTMYFIPQIWYIAIAVMLGLFVLLLMLLFAAFVAKAVGITAVELWLARTILRKR